MSLLWTRHNRFHERTTLGSPFPMGAPPRDDRETAAIEFIQEQAPGEVELDAVVRAQASSPQVVARMVALENCVWALASLLLSLPTEIREKIGAQGPLEKAKALLLKSIVLDHNLALPEAELPNLDEIP